MKLSSTTISAAVHIAALAVIVFLVKAEPRLPTPISAFVFGEETKKEEPPPPPPKKEEPPKKKDPPRQKAAAKSVTPTEVAAQTPKAENSSSKPLLDLGMVMDGDGEGIPEGAVVVPADMVGPPPTKKTDVPAQGGLVPQIVKKPACEEELVPPEPLARADVEYPPDVEGVTGRVVAVVKVAADGSIKDIQLVEGVHPDVDKAVLRSLAQWRFKAARRCSQRVEGTFRFAARFEATE